MEICISIIFIHIGLEPHLYISRLETAHRSLGGSMHLYMQMCLLTGYTLMIEKNEQLNWGGKFGGKTPYIYNIAQAGRKSSGSVPKS